MLPTSSLPSEAVSFWLGFLAATVFWLIIARLRPLFLRLWSSSRERVKAARQRGQDRTLETINRQTLLQAQSLHLSSPFFALDEILIQPRLLAPPPALVRPGPGGPDLVFHQVVPYLPDWPELAGALPAPTITLAEALQNGVPVAVIGATGAGKTVCLADLASRLARQTDNPVLLSGQTPVLVSIFDLLGSEETPDPLDRLVKRVTPLFPKSAQKQPETMLPKLAAAGQLALLVDGIDELAPKELDQALTWLSAMLARYPQITCAITAGSHQVAEISKTGFLPLTVAPWSHAAVFEFALGWSRKWQGSQANTSDKDSRPVEIDPRILASWLAGTGHDPLTPLEWTLKVWSATTGEIGGSRNQDAIEEYVRRCTQNKIPPQALGVLAGEFLRQGCTAISQSQLDEALSKANIAPAVEDQGETNTKSNKHVRRGKAGEVKLSRTGQILQRLLECGLLIKDSRDLIRMVHPVLTGYLAAGAPAAEPQVNLTVKSTWAVEMEASRFLAARAQSPDTVMRLIERDTPPFFPGLMGAARWLKDAPSQAGWRPAVMRRLLTVLNDESQPFSQRGRLIAAFVTARDPSVPMAFKQLLGSKDPALRQLLALGLGAIGSPQFIGELVNLLADPVADVRCAACLALAALDHPVAEEAIFGALYEGDEVLQQAAAEALANKGPQGTKILQEAIKSDNLMARRAAVTGIGLIREPWAHEALEKISVEDAQWTVRTSAALALEAQQDQTRSLPLKLPPPSDSPWLIAFAGKQGVGVPADRFPGELLLDALHHGTQEERQGALIYLRDVRTESVAAELQNTACDGQQAIREASLYALWLRGASVRQG